MRSIFLAGLFGLAATAVEAQQAPKFFAETYPEYALGDAMNWYGTLRSDAAPLDRLTSELIMLGVAAQIPCDYCIYAHRKNALAAGATEAQLRDAIAVAGAVRMWSTVLNGSNYEYDAFVSELDAMSAGK